MTWAVVEVRGGSGARRVEVREQVGIALDAAVPLWMLELARIRDQRERDATRMRWAHDGATVIGSEGDSLQYGGKRGRAANAFNHLARGLAALAFAPGGVTFAGRHWCTDHQVCVAAEETAAGDRNSSPADGEAYASGASPAGVPGAAGAGPPVTPAVQTIATRGGVL